MISKNSLESWYTNRFPGLTCDNCGALNGDRMSDDETVLCPPCVEAIQNHNDRLETEQDALRATM